MPEDSLKYFVSFEGMDEVIEINYDNYQTILHSTLDKVQVRPIDKNETLYHVPQEKINFLIETSEV